MWSFRSCPRPPGERICIFQDAAASVTELQRELKAPLVQDFELLVQNKSPVKLFHMGLPGAPEAWGMGFGVVGSGGEMADVRPPPLRHHPFPSTTPPALWPSGLLRLTQNHPGPHFSPPRQPSPSLPALLLLTRPKILLLPTRKHNSFMIQGPWQEKEANVVVIVPPGNGQTSSFY